MTFKYKNVLFVFQIRKLNNDIQLVLLKTIQTQNVVAIIFKSHFQNRRNAYLHYDKNSTFLH